MQSSSPNRRVFLASAAAAVGTASVAHEARGAAAHPEVQQWTKEIGSRFNADGETLVLRSVSVMDRSTETARPRDIRQHTIELFFARESGKRSRNDAVDLRLEHRSEQLLLSRVVAPEGETGAFYEAVIN